MVQSSRPFAVRMALLILVTTIVRMPVASAQWWADGWTVSFLHPMNTGESYCTAASDGQQVGDARMGTALHASVWDGTAASWVDLHPAGGGWTESHALAVSQGQQVGWVGVTISNLFHASLWSGSAASRIDLNPPGNTTGSKAYAIQNGWQGGCVSLPGPNGPYHAALWNGSADSWIDLHPTSLGQSCIYAICESQQAGSVSGGAYSPSATLWNGSAGSWVNLHPIGYNSSVAYAVTPQCQAGYVIVDADYHASVWHGTAQSWVDLNPPGSSYSKALAAFANIQVGESNTSNGQSHAILWTGTVESRVDLHSFVPLPFYSSSASGISSDSVNLSITGFAGYPRQAILWTRPICAADFNFDGVLNSVDFLDFLTAFFMNDSTADFNRDGNITAEDFFSFLIVFFAGC